MWVVYHGLIVCIYTGDLGWGYVLGLVACLGSFDVHWHRVGFVLNRGCDELFFDATKLADGRAAMNLALCLDAGAAVPPQAESADARFWLEQAARSGLAIAQVSTCCRQSLLSARTTG